MLFSQHGFTENIQPTGRLEGGKFRTVMENSIMSCVDIFPVIRTSKSIGNFSAEDLVILDFRTNEPVKGMVYLIGGIVQKGEDELRAMTRKLGDELGLSWANGISVLNPLHSLLLKTKQLEMIPVLKKIMYETPGFARHLPFHRYEVFYPTSAEGVTRHDIVAVYAVDISDVGQKIVGEKRPELAKVPLWRILEENDNQFHANVYNATLAFSFFFVG